MLAVLLIEAVWLIAKGHGAANVIAALLPAALIVIGVRNALTDMPWPWIAGPMAIAFPVHLWDLKRRGMIGG